jgi:hypothetical protein
VQNSPRWCSTGALIDVKAFKWNSPSGTAPSTTVANYFMQLDLDNSAAPFFSNIPGTTNNIYGFCEE